jgi:peptide methionine sulfoxide reductase msrA/msrB
MQELNYTFMSKAVLTTCVLLLLGLSGAVIFSGCTLPAEGSGGARPAPTPTPTPEVQLNPLTKKEERIIIDKGTDGPFTGKLTDNFEEGKYYCRQCNAELYVSNDKFHSGCGWPSFDQEIPGAVTKVPDADGRRTEIICSSCKGHLGHVFYGEGFTDKNTRHCVNTTSLVFVPTVSKKKGSTAVFAGGCFWGVEYYFLKEKGVKSVKSGYTGGTKTSPTYEDVLGKKSGHYEAVEVEFNPKQTTYETLTRLFFEVHDPTQTDGQGPDIGQQYQSVIFYQDEAQKQTAEKLIKLLEEKGLRIATQLKPARKFWKAEEYHQRYYEKNGGTPYCHKRVKRF